MNQEFLGFLSRLSLLAKSANETNSILHRVFRMELVFWVAVILLALLVARSRARWFRRIEQSFLRIARHRHRAVLGVFLGALLLRAALLVFLPIPVPAVHDEFSYILQGETFAAGRLTNPVHPMAIFFETFHVNMWPTYQSMYPPAQGLVLALGILLFGHPWWGVWLSMAIMCAVVCWMLQAYMPPHWALLGAVFCVLRFDIFSYWINAYLGGAVAAAAGAVLLGTWPRLRRNPCIPYGLLFGFALIVLANSRPWEGLVCSVPCTIAALAWLFRERRRFSLIFRKAVVPVVVVLILGAAFMLYYNWRGTGNPLEMPYIADQMRYHITKPFIWEKRNPIPHYDHPAMRRVYVYWELPSYLMLRYPQGRLELFYQRCLTYYEFYFWPAVLLLIPGFLIACRSRRLRLLPITALMVILGVFVEIYPPFAQYAAPALACFIAVMLVGFRAMRAWSIRGRRIGLAMSRAFILLLAVWFAVRTGEQLIDPYHFTYEEGAPRQEIQRASIVSRLDRLPGKQLVIVHMSPSFGDYRDWVYNKPDIDASHIVWARDMGPANRSLLQYFHDRTVWWVDQSDGMMALRPYTPADSQ